MVSLEALGCVKGVRACQGRREALGAVAAPNQLLQAAQVHPSRFVKCARAAHIGDFAAQHWCVPAHVSGVQRPVPAGHCAASRSSRGKRHASSIIQHGKPRNIPYLSSPPLGRQYF